MPYQIQSWKDGSTGSTFEATAAKFEHMEQGIRGAYLTVSVKEEPYNAKGDGVANDTAAIKSAIEAVKAAGGGTVNFPAGKYKADIELSSVGGDAPVNLEGVGRQATEIIKHSAGATAAILIKTTTAGEFINNSRVRQMSVFGKAKEGPGILIERCAWGHIEDVECFNCSVGIEGKGIISYTIDNCILFNANTKGIVLTRSTEVSTVGSNSVSVRKCIISNCKTAGLEADYCPGLLVDSCDVESNGEAGKTATGGIRIGKNVTSEFGAGAVVIRGLWAEGNLGRAVTVESGEARLRDCMIFATDEATTTTEGRDFFVPAAATVTRVTITDCNFPTTVSAKKQIVVEAAECRGEISNCLTNQLYTVPVWMTVKSDSVYTMPLRFGTTSLTNITALETTTGGLSLIGGHIQTFTIGKGLAIREGTDAKQGISGAMVAGKVTVANKSVTANSRIILTRQNGGANPGAVFVSARTAGTSFAIESTSATDTGTVAYQIFEPAE